MRNEILEFLEDNQSTNCEMLIKTFGLNLNQLSIEFPELVVIEQSKRKLLYFGEVLIFIEENDDRGNSHYFYHFSKNDGIVSYRTDDLENYFKQLLDPINPNKILGELDYSVMRNDLRFNLKNPIFQFIRLNN